MSVSFNGPLLAGRWRIGPRIGQGGQGSTYVTRDEQEQRLVIAKEFRLEHGWKRFDLFERECKVLAALRHPGIPRFLDRVEAEGGVQYLIMEKAPGRTLKEISRSVRFSEAELRDLARRVLEILAYLHSRKPPVIHRDIKPANLLRAQDGAISLVDFGGVRAAATASGSAATVVGTFGYMAPEQLHGDATARADLYGLGATLVALAGGTEPEDVPRAGLKMDLETHLPDLSPRFRQFLEKMTHPEPEMRPASVVDALTQLQDGEGAAKLPARVKKGESVPPMDPDLEDPSLPGPFRKLLRTLLYVVGAIGYVSLTVAHAVFVPAIFWILYTTAKALNAKPTTQQRISEAKTEVKKGVLEARRAFLTMQKRPRALP